MILKTSARQQCGFTLLEMLIGLALLGLMLTLMFGGLRLGMRSWDGGYRASDDMSRVRVFEAFVRRQLSEAYPYFWKSPDQATLAFSGEPHAVRFVGFLPSGSGGRSGPYLLALEIQHNGRMQRVVLKSRPVSPDSRDFSGLPDIEDAVLASGVLAESVEALEFGYFGAESDQNPPHWQPQWHHPKKLPQLIRLRVKMANGQAWPEMIVAPRVNGFER